MSAVLTTASRITCSLQGEVSTSGQSKLTVAGKPVLSKDGVAGKTMSGCTGQTDKTNKCEAVKSVSGGEATKLKVGGSPVMLETLAGEGGGTHPATTLSALANQTKLKAV